MNSGFINIINDNQKRLRFIARRFGGKEFEEDVYQEILLQLWRSFNSFRGQSSVATWLYRIGLNTALMWQRKEYQAKEAYSNTIPDAVVPDGQCQATLLEDFFNSLNEVDSVVLMMYLDDIPSTDVADVLGITVNPVHIRINRLKQKFSERYVS